MEQKKSKKKLLIIIAFVALIAVIGILGVVIYRLSTKKPEEAQKPERAVSEGLVVGGSTNQKASEARFTTDMNMTWTFPSGSDTSNNAIIGNSVSNLYECYFEVYL